MSKQTVDEAMEVTKKYYTATQPNIDSMPEKARKHIKDMAEAVAVAVDEEPKEVYAFVSWYAHRPNNGGYVTRGKNGGFIKGVRPVKQVKPAADWTTTDTTVDSTDAEA